MLPQRSCKALYARMPITPWLLTDVVALFRQEVAVGVTAREPLAAVHYHGDERVHPLLLTKRLLAP